MIGFGKNNKNEKGLEKIKKLEDELSILKNGEGKELEEMKEKIEKMRKGLASNTKQEELVVPRAGEGMKIYKNPDSVPETKFSETAKTNEKKIYKVHEGDEKPVIKIQNDNEKKIIDNPQLTEKEKPKLEEEPKTNQYDEKKAEETIIVQNLKQEIGKKIEKQKRISEILKKLESNRKERTEINEEKAILIEKLNSLEEKLKTY